ncbi:unnamed protein product [Bathycoccus prasinos]
MARFSLLFLSLSSVLRILALAFTSVGVSMVTAADFEGRNAPVLDFGGKIGSKNFERGRKEEDERKTVGESILGKTVPPTFTLEEEDTTFENNNRKKNENKCEECLSFLHNATEKVRSKEFRARLYKVVDEMCQRVFPDDAGEEGDKKIAECEALGKTYAKRAIEYVKTHEEKTDEFVCEKLNLCADDDATVFDALRRTVRRAREAAFASGRRFFASSWFHPSSASSSASPPTSLCVFCEYGASKLAVAMNDPGFCRRREARFRRRVPSRRGPFFR